jgi:microcystin-dependent protein
MALPNLQGRAALHADGAHPRGWHGGEAAHTLTVPEMPGHTHTPMGSSAAAASPQPSGRTWGIPEKIAAYTDAKPDQAMAADALAATGDGAAHDNMQPWLALNHCICADGVPDSGLNPFVAEIRLYAGATPPKGWALCDGQVLPIQGNAALHSLLGNRFGGDGVKTFALPDLRGRVPLHHGQGPGLTDRPLGQQGGEAATYLKPDELPAHTHAAQCAGVAGSASPAGQVWATAAGPTPEGTLLYANVPDTPMSAALVGATGGGQPHNNMQPSLALNFIIALQGTFPPRS